MAPESDDATMEINDATFDVDSEFWGETTLRVCLSTVQNDDMNGKCDSTVNCKGVNFKGIDQGDERLVSYGSATSVECQSNHSMDNVHNDPQFDDEFDALLMQIDESEMKKMATPQKITKSTKDFSSSGLEASFFSSQDNKSPHTPLKRRFPGPAGLLPHLRKEELNLIKMTPHPVYQKVPKLVSYASENNYNTRSARVRFSSTTIRKDNARVDSGMLLGKAPWEKMIKSLNLSMKDEKDLLNIFNIKWLRANAKKFPEGMKIPFLAGIVQETLDVDSSKKKLLHRNPSIKLMDPTGTIVAAFSPNFMDAYGSIIIPGTALALRNCRVITLKKNLILAVATENLIYLATTRPDDTEEEPHTDKLYEIKNGPLFFEKILEEYNELSMKLNAQCKADFQDHGKTIRQTDMDFYVVKYNNPPSLFNTVSSERNQKIASESVLRTPHLEPERSSIKVAAPGFQQNQELETANFSVNPSYGFDDDDDDEVLQALDCIDFVIDENNM